MPPQSGKIALVTGANSGLGFATAKGLAQAGATVIMACRNPAKAQTALQQIRDAAPQSSVETLPLDLADLASVRRFASEFSSRYPRLDLLCNNAGVMALPYGKTRDGFELQIGINHLGPFALTGLLMEALTTSASARIINVASLAHKATQGLVLDDLNWERHPYNKADAYAKSKLANLLFTYELDRRLQKAGRPIIAVAAHPGYSATNIGDGTAGTSWLKQQAFKLGNLLFAQPAAQGALPTLYAATMPEVRGGDYYGPHSFFEFRGYPIKVASKSTARDPQTATALWSLSEQLTGIKYL